MEQNYSINQKNGRLCKDELELIASPNFMCRSFEPIPGAERLAWIRVRGLSAFWGEGEPVRMSTLTADVLKSTFRANLCFGFAVRGSPEGISVYIGTGEGVLLDALRTSYEGQFPGIELEDVSNPFGNIENWQGGLIVGTPSDTVGGAFKQSQIDTILRGMYGRRFLYTVIALGIHPLMARQAHSTLLQELSRVYPLINHTNSGGGSLGATTEQVQDFVSKGYFENLQALEQTLQEATASGLWRVGSWYLSPEAEDALRLRNLLKAAFSGDKSKPEPIRLIDWTYARETLQRRIFPSQFLAIPDAHPLCTITYAAPNGSGMQTVSDNSFVRLFQTQLSSEQLAQLCQLPTKELPGYYVDSYVEFDLANRVDLWDNPLVIGDICAAGRSGRSVDNSYAVEREDLTRHALVIGITGGGKTNTCKSLLSSLWNAEKKTPFLVIESAKREYWELRNLKGFDELLVFTLGSEAEGISVKYRINPFETQPGISLQTHIDYLLATFKAAFELYPPMPYVLEQAVYEVYSDRGWDIAENANRYGLAEYPTLSDLYKKIEIVVDNLGYHQEVQSNVKAALQARIHSLMIGGKGAMLDTPVSVPIDRLLRSPVVMELEDLGDDETKSFVIGILLVQLYEYRKSQMKSGAKGLEHLLVVEEAHRLLKNIPESGEGGNTRARSVEFFCNMLAEIRTFGQGILISDQIPTKLAPDTMKNTNLKIVHRTVAAEDREAIGQAMNMTSQQIDSLSSLRRGYAVVYAEGDNRPKCVKIPLMTPVTHDSREDVLQESNRHVSSWIDSSTSGIAHHVGCAYCEHRCRYYDQIHRLVDQIIKPQAVLQTWAARSYHGGVLRGFLWDAVYPRVSENELPRNEFAARCLLGEILVHSTELSSAKQQQILTDYLRYVSEYIRSNSQV